jgi:hypothetical protein
MGLTQQQWNREMERLQPQNAAEASVSIVIVVGAALQQFGTGTLFRIGDEAFLVTAGHVIAKARARGKTLAATTKKSFVSLSGEWIVNERPFDVALLRLSHQVVEKLDGMTFLRLDDVSFDENLSHGIFTVFGFPSIWSSPSTDDGQPLDLQPLRYTALMHDGDTNSLGGFSPRYHLLLSAQLEGVTDLNGNDVDYVSREGFRADFPGDLGGMSGASVWVIGDRRLPITEWHRRSPRIVAVQTGAYRGKPVLQATRWIAVSTLLYEAFPVVRPSLNMWRVD